MLIIYIILIFAVFERRLIQHWIDCMHVFVYNLGKNSYKFAEAHFFGEDTKCMTRKLSHKKLKMVVAAIFDFIKV